MYKNTSERVHVFVIRIKKNQYTLSLNVVRAKLFIMYSECVFMLCVNTYTLGILYSYYVFYIYEVLVIIYWAVKNIKM